MTTNNTSIINTFAETNIEIFKKTNALYFSIFNKQHLVRVTMYFYTYWGYRKCQTKNAGPQTERQTSTVLWLLQRTTYVSRHHHLRTGGF